MKRQVFRAETEEYCEGCKSWVPENTELDGVVHIQTDHTFILNANKALQKMIKKRVTR
jgi:hypothetical protein